MTQSKLMDQSSFFVHIRKIQQYFSTRPVIGSVLLCFFLMASAWTAVWLIAPLAPFGDYTLCTNDGYAQYMPFLSLFRSTIVNGNSFLYSFDGALGMNFYLTIAYYLFSPFSFLVLLFDASQIPAAANLIIILKNIMTGCIMAGFLASRRQTRSLILPVSCAIAYALGYYFLGYAVNFMWMDSIALMPLMIIGMENIHLRKGRILYLFSLAAAILCNFYMGAILCLFLGLYYLVILFEPDKKGWNAFFWFAFCSIAAAMLAGIVLMPVVFGMLGANAERMTVPEPEFFNDGKYVLSRFLPDAEVVRITHNRGTINLYMGSLVFFLIVLHLLQHQKNRRRQYGWFFLWVLFLFSTQFSWFNFALHGFYLQRQVPNRFGFLIGFLGALMAFEALSRIRNTKKWKILAAGIFSSLYFAAACLYADADQWWLALLLPAVILAETAASLKRKPRLAAWMMTIECLAQISMCAPGTLGESYTNMARYLNAASYSKNGRGEILASNIVNAPTLYHLQGLSAFNSVINPDTAGFLGKLGYAAGENYYRFYGWTPVTAMMCSIQTIIAYPGAQLPYPYLHIGDDDGLAIWQTRLQVPIGLTGLDASADLSSVNEFKNISALFPDTFEDVPLKADIEAQSEIEGSQNEFTVKDLKEDDETVLRISGIECEEFYLFATMSGSESFKAEKNGEVLEDNSYEGNIVYCGSVQPDDQLKLTFKADDDKDSAKVRVFGAFLDPSKTAAVIGRLQNGGLKNAKIENSEIRGTIDLDAQDTLVFTIPYDTGWKAEIDGVPAETESYQNAFVSLPVPAGTHEVSLAFHSPGWKEGMALSLSGAAAALAVILIPDKKRKKRKQMQPR